MNQAQRKFLIDKITQSVNETVRALTSSREDEPSLSNYLFHVVMSGTFAIKSNEEIREMIREKALNSKSGRDSWLGTRSIYGGNNRSEISFEATDFFILPEEYKKVRMEYEDRQKQLDAHIYNLKMQSDGLITRIQLASDRTLQTMINEVDDMGNISLMDTRLKELTSPSLNKQLNG